MKKKIIISSLITLLAIPTFAGCDSNSTSSNQITSSNSQGVVTELRMPHRSFDVVFEIE